MWKTSLFIISLLSILFLSFINDEKMTIQEGDHRLDWSEYIPLDWSDFQAIPPGMSRRNIAAITSSVIQYRYYCEEGEIKYNVKSVFLKDESWVRETARTNDYLRHEQLHFDITEVYSRKLKRFLGQRKYYCDDVKEFERQISKILSDWREMQSRYDKETHYSLNYQSQQYWIDYINDLLIKYEDHK